MKYKSQSFGGSLNVYGWFLAWEKEKKSDYVLFSIPGYGYPTKSEVIKETERALETSWRSLRRQGARAIKCEIIPLNFVKQGKA